MKPDMKTADNIKIFIALCLMSAAVLSCSGSREAVRDIVTNENTEADLGRIREKDGPVQVNLLVANETSDTLMPVAAYTRCQCVSASVERRGVPPGKYIRVEVVYNPAYKKGIFMEEIAVQMLGHKPLSLIVKGDVIPMVHHVEEDHPYDFGSGLHLSHEVLHYGKMDAGEKKDIFIRYANGRRRSVNLGFEISPEWAGAVDFRSSIMVGKGGRDTMHFKFTMPDNIPEGYTLKIPVYPCIDGKPAGKVLTVKAISRGKEQKH